jgi:osmotically-inducible protein OsmY
MRQILFVLLIAAPLVNGCAPLVVGGAAVTGVMIAEDRRTVGAITEDQGIEFRAGSRIRERIKNANIGVTSYNRMVLLTGQVPDPAAKAEAERIARAVENVRGVYNELEVGGNRSLKERAHDAYITSKVKARFVDGQKFSPLHVKVVTENNAVYLLGLVHRKEANDATEIARTTGGVQKVVRIFEYLD